MKSTPNTTATKHPSPPSQSAAPHRPLSSSNAPSATPLKGGNAAVPISIYRELVAELQHTQQRLREVSDRNEQLAEHNQQLRHEIEQVVHVALQVRSVANDIQPEAPILPQLVLQPVQSTHELLNQPPSELPAQRLGQDNADVSHSLEESPNTTSLQPEWVAQVTPQSVTPESEPSDMDVPAQTAELDHVVAAAIARQIPKASQAPETVSPIITSSGTSTDQRSVSIETLDGTVTLKLPTPNQPLTTEQRTQSTHGQGSDRSSKTSSFGGWWLTVIVIFVVISAFGAGFMAMLFLQGQRNINPNN
ncbi:MAG: hypothetical protein AAF327_22150 [Cyanobacteria bacterium P01_A01_bin.37]